ncbi:class I SAM-dependent methyltransferase [Pseudomonas sp. NEEL19]|uniref:class I SAM-dependent methyltransferase n=1 Tax=Pseudomonas sp. NEEL19 TaxID=2867409 RepID=UPI002367E5DD|nr:class I SAM-dependent methyltransferase [Pseudomonas sp. NEEL19]WDM57314.1 class I SAM-dependent methyltransferase [Pseudomonas sp. NEEL19]
MDTFSQQSLGEASLDHDLEQSAMLKLATYFHDLATGASQVPSQPLDSHIKSQIDDPQVLEYHDRLIAGAGPLFSHFLASVPYILEELSRVGVALSRLVSANPPLAGQRYSMFEVDGFDGSNGRALAGHSKGLIVSFTCSPNLANQVVFERHADPAMSYFYPHSFFKVTTDLLQKREYHAFKHGFDFIYEMAAFQFYSRDRGQQIDHIQRCLKPTGLVFFLEKLNHPDLKEYRRRERVKDEVFKTRYFTEDEIFWKREQMLAQMQNGQVSWDELASALSVRFKHVHMLWNSSNFCEFVASNDTQRIEQFLSLLGPIAQPPGFCFEGPRLGSASVHHDGSEVTGDV